MCLLIGNNAAMELVFIHIGSMFYVLPGDDKKQYLLTILSAWQVYADIIRMSYYACIESFNKK